MQGIITNIQRFSIHDGPGIRTTVFLKGCNLRCFWCHNPEDIRPQPEIQFFPERCITCGVCVQRCPNDAHAMRNGIHIYLRDRCTACGACTETCYAGGVVRVGKVVDVEDVMAEIRQDAPFYASSGGGVTLSGGEPLLQLDFAQAIFRACRAEGIHTAIETAANFPWQRVEAILPYVDLVMMDIKHIDSARHREVTGVPNERILENARRLGEQSLPLIVRTPVIPGVNDSAEVIDAIAAFVAGLPNVIHYELLPYHPMAQSKYDSLDLHYQAADLIPPSKAQMAALAEVALAAGAPA
ncbi:MAG: glycyl-radical enzyme activating protein [Caldilineaceae bacterium]|nr:glycyl-radical enzyme activating protein [Caldilineaceae bacterium]